MWKNEDEEEKSARRGGKKTEDIKSGFDRTVSLKLNFTT
jgi:hypothetical protein